MTAEFKRIVESNTLDADEIARRTALIHDRLLSESEFLDAPNFTCIHPDDLKRLLVAYDNQFFGGSLKTTLGSTPLEFRLSKRMTSAGGKTTCLTDRTSGKRRFEISVSTTILFECFDGENDRPLTAYGVNCLNRLDALQRVMEHELTHLIEMLLWDHSSCSQSRFHSITRRFFGHRENKHQLITPRERASERNFRNRTGYDGPFSIRWRRKNRSRQSNYQESNRAGRRPARNAILQRQTLRKVLRPGRTVGSGGVNRAHLENQRRNVGKQQNGS